MPIFWVAEKENIFPSLPAGRGLVGKEFNAISMNKMEEKEEENILSPDLDTFSTDKRDFFRGRSGLLTWKYQFSYDH